MADGRIFPPLSAFTDLDVPDRDAFLDLTYKYTDAPGLQLQLCEPGPGGSPQRQFLDRTGGGVFHLGFVVDDVDAGTEAARSVGLEPWMYGRRPDSTGFTYLQTPPSAGVTLGIRQSPNF
ncbi:hypothetical protein ACFVKB_37710 [Rhodococcus sp. NPDC127530]|uniref:hypothetical protein n=1 Tax=unclassified Rhodococcus (in: high G+C Gram-positive bacteria) TaxID=192944 RepID=UPI00364223CF